MQGISIVHFPTEREPFAVIIKNRGLPSAPLSDFDTQNAFSYAASAIPCLRNVHGRKKIEHGLLHRIDTETQGLLLIAATQEFYDFMLAEQDNGEFLKTYRAECEFLADNSRILGGFPKEFQLPVHFFDEDNLDFKKHVRSTITVEKMNRDGTEIFEICSYFRNFGKGSREVRPVTEQSGRAAEKKRWSKKLYKTQLKILERHGNTIFVECSLKNGYRHQIRCHLAWNGIPIIGDTLYNSCDKHAVAKKREMHFKACALDFFNPVTEKRMHFTMN
ncbi:MAG: RNA pseudouridine synthase [Treponema sp.]|nr:RNA pseudouridine synthase [Treponema sp.]